MLTVIATHVAVNAGSHREVRSRLAVAPDARNLVRGLSIDTIVQ
jgi:hypothetical protein